MRPWHKAKNLLRDARYVSLTPAVKGVYRDMCELLSESSPLRGNITNLANWLSTDRKTMREALIGIESSGLLLVTSEDKGKSGTFYTVSDPDLTPSKPQASPEQAPTLPQASLNLAPDKSQMDAGLQDSSLIRRELEEKREENNPLSPGGGECEGQPEGIPFSEPLPEHPDDLPDLEAKTDREPAHDTPPTTPHSAPPPIAARRTVKPAPKPRRHEYTPAFEAFWKAYPGGGSKAEAFTQWKAAGLERDEALRDTASAALETQKAHRAKFDAIGEFHPQWKDAERWLKHACWEEKLRPLPTRPHGLRVIGGAAAEPESDDPQAKYAWW